MAQSKNVVTINQFRGCDFTNAGTDMDADKSPNCVNMIRDVPGKIRKRMGYKFDKNYGDRINGYHYLANEKQGCLHVGTKIVNLGDTRGTTFEEYDVTAEGKKIEYTVNGALGKLMTDDEKEKRGYFIGVGANGVIKSKSSTLTVSKTLKNMNAICFGADRYVAVGAKGAAYYSVDNGETWIKMQGIPETVTLNDVAYDSTQYVFIAVGVKAIYVSRDGVNWYNPCTSTLTQTFYAVGNRTIASLDFYYTDDHSAIEGSQKLCSYNTKPALIVGAKAYAIYKKGSTPSKDKVTVGTLQYNFREVIGVNGEVYAVGDSGKLIKLTAYKDSANEVDESGITLKTALYEYRIDTVTTNLPSKTFYGGMYGYINNNILVVGAGGNVYKTTVNNMSTWIKCTLPNKRTCTLSDIAYNGSMYIITSSDSNYIFYSTDLETWEERKLSAKSWKSISAQRKDYEYENIYKVHLYFNDSTSETVLASDFDVSRPVLPIPDYEANFTGTITLDLSGITKEIRYAVSNFNITGDVKIISNGNELASGYNAIYVGCADERSISVPFDNKLYILDGSGMLQYDGYSVLPVSDIAYIPTLTISKDPSGGGTDFEALNLLQPGFTETFYVKSGKTATKFQMTFGELDETEVKAWVKDSNADWIRKYENTDFTVDRITGVVTFTSAVSASPIEGEDNVKITAYRTVDGYADRINKCTVACLFGVGGAQDRVFVSGNPDKKYMNYDWYSQQNDATYFGDTSYCMVGNTSSKIVGYAIINNYLAAFKGEGELHQNVVIRQGNLTDSKPSFPLVNTLQGEAAIAPHSFQYLATEPVFLTKSGIMAITSQDITSEKYTQDRSFYLNGKLLKERAEDLESACSVVYNDMYLLAVNGRLYVLDGIQPMQTDKSLPYATRQYAGFYCTNIPARVMWVDADNVLCFGTDTGDVFKFYTDKDDIESYTDNGEAIEAVYETPDMGGKVFFKNKTFKFLAVRLGKALRASMKIFTQRGGLWTKVKEDNSSAGYFSFGHIDFSRITFSTDDTQKVLTTKLRVKKVDKMRVRLVNDANKEPFSIYDIGMEYTERGNHK